MIDELTEEVAQILNGTMTAPLLPESNSALYLYDIKWELETARSVSAPVTPSIVGWILPQVQRRPAFS